MSKWVYSFGVGATEGRAHMKVLLGGKGANLAEMSAIGLPVPPGFTLTTEVCLHYYDSGRTFPAELAEQVQAALSSVEAAVGARFGDAADPLLLSVRSGARASMPGMMDTVLNLGLNDATAAGLLRRSGDARFVFDSYRRFVQMYADVVLGLEHERFEALLTEARRRAGVRLDSELGAEQLQALVASYKAYVRQALGRPFPEDPWEQLWGSIGAVFGSWMNPRAVKYRELNQIPASWGTAVNVQAMVFGNMGSDCATGVAFTRNPSTGANDFYGEFLVNAQGEDVVAGIRTPQPLTLAAKRAMGSELPSLEEAMPGVFRQLMEIRQRLEQHFKDMQDIEFTVQSGRLYMLQTRTGKRTAPAAIKIAVDMVQEGLIQRTEALMRVQPDTLEQVLHPTLDPAAPKQVIAVGLPASPGAVSGRVVFSADAATEAAKRGEAVILVRVETSPEDIHGIHAAKGVLTTRGGMTSHAAVVARGMGRPCVCGAGNVHVDYKAGLLRAGGQVVREGEPLTIDGGSGSVMLGTVATVKAQVGGDFGTLLSWADEVRRLGVRANAETPADARAAREFGADGIGLVRTEHMFFEASRIVAVREMILARDEAGRRAALAKLLPMQRDDLVELFRIMAGRPVTVRLLDPPLHEFLPTSEAEMVEVARAAGLSPAAVRSRTEALKETNPMLGHRGCRLAVTYPEICEMQVRAVFEAAAVVAKEAAGAAPVPEVMVPLVASLRELDMLKDVVDRTARAVMAEAGVQLRYLVGTMIELPRAALLAGQLAGPAEFFSFGTNDLTQTTFGLSRDDAGAFLPEYVSKGILDRDPFVTLDQEGVGELVRMAALRGRATRPNLKLGICGEHGGDPASIRFCESAGLDYVSCSPFRVPVARLAAAQAALEARSRAQQEAAGGGRSRL